MEERRRKRRMFLRRGHRLSFRGRKNRSKSLDLTSRSASSSQLSVDATEEPLSPLEHQGTLSKATSLLFRRKRALLPSAEEPSQDSLDSPRTPPRKTCVSLPISPPSSPSAAGHSSPIVVTESEEEVIEEFTNHRQDPAIQARRQAIQAQQILYGENHPDVLFAMQCLAQVHYNRGEHKEAQLVLAEVQNLSRQHLGDDDVPRDVLVISRSNHR